jgi:hypothetical protein
VLPDYVVRIEVFIISPTEPRKGQPVFKNDKNANLLAFSSRYAKHSE